MKSTIQLEVQIIDIPDDGNQFIEWCEEYNVEPFGEGDIGRRGWCSWLGEYIRDNDCLIYITDPCTTGAFLARKEYLKEIK